MGTDATGLRARKKLQTRLALARAAMRLFEERGYAATTIDDIAAEANVSRRTFFRYFESKNEAFIVDPVGKLEALHVALAEGPPDEPTIAAVRRGLLALTTAYFEPDLVRAEARVGAREPAVLAAGLAYQVRWEDELARRSRSIWVSTSRPTRGLGSWPTPQWPSCGPASLPGCRMRPSAHRRTWSLTRSTAPLPRSRRSSRCRRDERAVAKRQTPERLVSWIALIAHASGPGIHTGP